MGASWRKAAYYLIKKILKHVGLWEVKGRPPPKAHSPPGDLHTDYSNSQIPHWDDDQTSESHTHHIVLPICPPKTHTTTMLLNNWKAEKFDATKRNIQ